jgi:outer membrane biosynthesis protein TonB
VTSLTPSAKPKFQDIVKIRIATQDKEAVTAPTPLPPRPAKREIPKKQLPAPNQVNPQTKTTTETPVQGLTKESLSEGGTMAAPLGNTLMTEDMGKRLKTVDPLKGDLSQPAKLVVATLNPPPYTDDALDAGLEGSFIVDVFVNLDGSVREAELRKKIGYGMDTRVIAAVKASKFIPRKNRFGVSEEGWTELKFTLVIP